MEKIVTTVYKADDGRMFDTEEECIKHEAAHGAADFYNDAGRAIDVVLQERFEFDVFFANCYAVHVTSEHCQITNNLKTQIWEKGWYFYDCEQDDWFKVPETYEGWIQP